MQKFLIALTRRLCTIAQCRVIIPNFHIKAAGSWRPGEIMVSLFFEVAFCCCCYVSLQVMVGIRNWCPAVEK